LAAGSALRLFMGRFHHRRSVAIDDASATCVWNKDLVQLGSEVFCQSCDQMISLHESATCHDARCRGCLTPMCSHPLHSKYSQLVHEQTMKWSKQRMTAGPIKLYGCLSLHRCAYSVCEQCWVYESQLPPVKKGFMIKLGHGLISLWQRRYFVLSGGVLCYYLNSAAMYPYGVENKGSEQLGSYYFHPKDANNIAEKGIEIHMYSELLNRSFRMRYVRTLLLQFRHFLFMYLIFL